MHSIRFNKRQLQPLFTTCLVLLMNLTAYGNELITSDQYNQTDNKTLERYVDPLIIEGQYLPDIINLPIEGYRLFACLDNAVVSIPFQIDEITPEGYKVLPDGPEGNPEKANQIFDKQDELLFMSFDTGHRITFSRLPVNCQKYAEIEIQDPLNGQKGWVYLLYFDKSPPPRSPKFYPGIVKPEHPTGFEVETNNMTIKGKQVEYKDKTYNQIFYQGITTPPGAGGTGVDYIDRLKWHINISFLFNTIKISFDDDSLIGNFICWKIGPIRGTYRVWASATLPFGLKSPRFIADIVGYDKSISTSTTLNVPVNPGYVITKIVTRIGTDLSPDAIGMRFYNSENLQGFDIDGRMSKEEKSFNKNRDTWRLITGPQGTLMNRSTWTKNFLDQAEAVEVEYVDDLDAPDPPEAHEGQIGHASSVAKLKKLKPGQYAIFIEWYFPPNFYDPQHPKKINLDVVQHYLNFQDNPLKFSVGDVQGINKAVPVSAKKWK